MFEPGQRRLFHDALRPPEGYRFDCAVGTTFTLDLLALLSAPLAFTFRDPEDGEGQLASDPLALLESARRHASRIVLFCHGGQTSVPGPGQPALAFLEQSVVTALPPSRNGAQGVFHPCAIKPMGGFDHGRCAIKPKGMPARYRLVCQSRNLTFDSSMGWRWRLTPSWRRNAEANPNAYLAMSSGDHWMIAFRQVGGTAAGFLAQWTTGRIRAGRCPGWRASRSQMTNR